MKARQAPIVEERKVGSVSPSNKGLARLMSAEHSLLDELLATVAGHSGAGDIEAYQRFREGLLRHIRIEERILLPMAERKCGHPLPIAARLRLEHGALAALTMLPPGDGTFRAIRAILDAHNPLEEGEGGVYDQCERLAGPEIEQVLAQIASTPRVPVSAWVDSPRVFAAARRALARAGYDPALL